MNNIIAKLRGASIIPHFRLELPCSSKTVPKVISYVNGISKSSPALFVSINGMTEQPQAATSLYQILKYTSQVRKIPVYTFLEDNINGLSYYVATAGEKIIANPFCKISDLTVPTKSYTNISQLLKYFGVDFQKLGSKDTTLWSQRAEPNENQQKFTRQWLSSIEKKLTKQITANRNIPETVLQQFGNKILHPRKALQLKLIDQINTVNGFQQVRFPNAKITTTRYSIRSGPRSFSQREVNVINQMVMWMGLPKGALLAIEDPINIYIKDLVQIVQARMEDPEELAQLQMFMGKVIDKVQKELQNHEVINF